MESTLETEFEEKLYSYLKQNNRSAFTSRALVDRLKEITTDPQLRKYGRRNLQKILNKLRDNGKIRVIGPKQNVLVQNKTYYSFLDPEDPSGLQKQTFVSLKKVGVEPYPIQKKKSQNAIFETTPAPSIEEIKHFSKYKRTIKMGKRSGTEVWLIISLITGVIGAIIGFIWWFGLESWIGAGLGALIGFGIGFGIGTIFMILANLAKTKYFILVLLLITGIIGAVIGGFIGASFGQVALGILIGFLIGFFGPIFLAMGGGC